MRKLAPHLLALALAAIGRDARADGGPPTDAYEGIGDDPVDVHGFADLYLAGNFDDPSSHRSTLRSFDTTANEPAVGWLRLRVARRPRTFGFLVDLGVGDTARAYFEDDPAATDHPTLSHWLSHVGQAFATVVMPDGLAIDVGKFATPIGLEDNEALTNWNYSRSFVYTWDEPSLHTGARATYAIDPQVSVAAFWLNGWNANVLDGNTMRSYALAARWKPIDAVEAVLVYAGGLERAATDPTTLSFRNIVDAYVTYAITDTVSVAATADDAFQFWGVTGYARYAPVTWLAVAGRAERFADPDGAATGTKQVLASLTATLEARHVFHDITLVGRLEYRHDNSSTDVFERDTGLARTLDTLTLAVLASY
jgi:putative OmpL-like beta-barrel porin-2